MGYSRLARASLSVSISVPNRYMVNMSNALVAKLSDGQRECLRRVLRHQTSKDIARDLGVSPHTVDQRLRVAAKTLGVASRIEAALVLAGHENAGPELYQPAVYQSSDIASELHGGSFGGATTGVSVEAEPEQTVRERQLMYQAFVPEPHRSIALPFPLGAEDENKLNAWRRVGWIVVIAIASALAFGAILSGLESLGSLFHGSSHRVVSTGSPAVSLHRQEITMTDARIFTVKTVAHKLFALEDAIDKALADAAQFTGSLPEARTQLKLSAVVGQDVFDSAAATIASLNEARRNVVEMHARLDAVKTSMGMRTVAFGGACNKPSSQSGLSVVAQKAA